MLVKLVAYGIAKEILSGSQLDFNIGDSSDIGALKAALIDSYPEFEKLRSLRFAVGEEYREDDFRLNEKDEVVIIPPVSGG